MSNIEEYREVLGGKISLDIGGKHYTTTAQTLMESKYMRDLVEFYHGIAGSWFIDRDGILFREILYYLRTGELFDPENAQNLKRLKLEAQFYGLPNLETKIDIFLNQKSRTHVPPTERSELNHQQLKTDSSTINYPPRFLAPKPRDPVTGKISYDTAFLMQFQNLCLETDEDLSAFHSMGEELQEFNGNRRGMSRRQTSEHGGRGIVTPGGSGDDRNGSRDGRSEMGKFAGGCPLFHNQGSGRPDSLTSTIRPSKFLGGRANAEQLVLIQRQLRIKQGFQQ